ncbi:translesion error-prone DNA polymerase V autoproteolytic subunit [Endozoicomonas sp.]|uniref:translesion error-prone DNA polymerase V autoproteolytic subunit n=1 Tax=Endozoicomonas sp. TaxID=1892382 RepID=UPI002886FF90|nr:translesion error-prone DNA polymerase V autoproteolytic subunit [Endozoicomonas sp.]
MLKNLSCIDIQLYHGWMPMGFPSPAEDYKESRLSLDEHLIHHPAATFFCIAKGHSMSESGIGDGAILVVDRSLKVQDGDIVVVVLDGEHQVRCIRFNQGAACLTANADITPVMVGPEQDFEVWGVVSSSINKYRH